MAPTTDHEQVFPCPIFEGSEKRISVTFAPAAATAVPPATGMRALSRPQLDAMLDLAECQIVSFRSNEHFDAYVLSESSLFVYPDRMVLKTCGTTKLLSCVPHMLELAATIDLAPSRVKYTRASYLFPEKQPETHRTFGVECGVLHGMFAKLGAGSAYVLGDALNGLQWHTYVAGLGTHTTPTPAFRPVTATTHKTRHTVEICMTGLAVDSAAQFFRGDEFVSSQHVTATSGISTLFPGTDIDDYVFEPCGYSMNGQNHSAFMTIHITPEDGFSYASVEISGHDPLELDTHTLVSQVMEIFKPAHVAVALTTDADEIGMHLPKWESAFVAPLNYDCDSASYQEFKCGGHVSFFTLVKREDNVIAGGLGHLSLRVKEAAGFDSDGSGSAYSPRAVLKHYPSFKTITSAASLKAGSFKHDRTGSDGNGDVGMGSDTTSDNSSERLCNSLLIEPSEMSFEDIVSVHNAVPLRQGDAAAIDDHMRWLVEQNQLEDNFYVVDLGAVQRLYKAWGEALPRVHPHYAVKCNNDPALVAALAALGTGFDCASESEVAQVLALGVSPDRIVFANPCKRPCDIRMSAAKGVDLSTFDTESELHKLVRWCPGARVLLRIRADDPTARCPLGNKFGAEEYEWEALLVAARQLGVPVDGVSFHVGSGATNPAAFVYAVELARKAFDLGLAHGHDMKILDIGGGFCGGSFNSEGLIDLGGVPATLNSALDLLFPESTGVKIIAEPGRFFAESVATLGCLVYGNRQRPTPSGALGFDYWITDGLYGSMNCLLYDHATLAPRPLGGTLGRGTMYPSTVFGPTCDGLDTVVRDYPLPELKVGDWMVFPSMGAYTICGASKFNGVNAVDVPTYYVCSYEA